MKQPSNETKKPPRPPISAPTTHSEFSAQGALSTGIRSLNTRLDFFFYICGFSLVPETVYDKPFFLSAVSLSLMLNPGIRYPGVRHFRSGMGGRGVEGKEEGLVGWAEMGIHRMSEWGLE